MGNNIFGICGGNICTKTPDTDTECKLESKENDSRYYEVEKVRKIQNTFRASKIKENIKYNEYALMKEFDENLPNFGSYIKEEEMETQINPGVKILDEKLGQFVPDQIELNSFKHVFDRGPILFKNNTVYKGSWSYLGKRQGYGIYIDYDGLKYSGFWLDDKMHGSGRLIFDKTDYYEGQWKNGFANGKGMLVTSTDKYVGNWLDSIQEGYGEEDYSDGDVYKGNFKKGLKSGHGKFIWVDGTFYEGNFENDLLCGKGILRWNDGRSYEGDWVNNKMHGYGTFTWPGGKRYVGQYRNDKKEGQGTYYWSDEKYYSGQWNNNKQHGEGIFYLKGNSFEVMYRFGRLISTSIYQKKDADSVNLQAIEKKICEGIMSPLDENIHINIHTDSGKHNLEKVQIDESNIKERTGSNR